MANRRTEREPPVSDETMSAVVDAITDFMEFKSPETIYGGFGIDEDYEDNRKPLRAFCTFLPSRHNIDVIGDLVKPLVVFKESEELTNFMEENDIGQFWLSEQEAFRIPLATFEFEEHIKTSKEEELKGYKNFIEIFQASSSLIRKIYPFTCNYYVTENITEEQKGIIKEVREDLGGFKHIHISPELEKEEKQEIVFERLKEDLRGYEKRISSVQENFNPILFHHSKVLEAYQNEQTDIMLFLLYVFFESYFESTLIDHFEEEKQNEHSGTGFIRDLSFDKKVNLARLEGLITENEYRIVKEVKESRDSYAHELDVHHLAEKTSIEDNWQHIEEAIEIYEEKINVAESMLES